MAALDQQPSIRCRAGSRRRLPQQATASVPPLLLDGDGVGAEFLVTVGQEDLAFDHNPDLGSLH